MVALRGRQRALNALREIASKTVLQARNEAKEAGFTLLEYLTFLRTRVDAAKLVLEFAATFSKRPVGRPTKDSIPEESLKTRELIASAKPRGEQ